MTMPERPVGDADRVPRPRRSRSRRGALVPTIIVALALAVVAARQVAKEPAPTALRRGNGERAADFELPDLRDPDATVALDDYTGTPIVLNFCASWCVPCRREMPTFQALHERLGDQVAFVGVNHQDSRDAALALLADTGVDYDAGYDPQGTVAADYGLFGMPTTVFIAANGDVVATRTGEIPAAELERTIRDLLLGEP